MLDTKPLLLDTDFPPIVRHELSILQVNLGYLCNLSCTHCHVNAGPKRTELMSREDIDTLLEFIDARNIKVLDLTGGAPEMNPHFMYLVREARARDVTVIDRCNLTILVEPGYEAMAQFLADQQVIITASLPCYLEDNVAEQRGKGVFQDSIAALKKLNDLGYGTDKSLKLDLVYNPNGDFLPPPQAALEADYKRELHQRYGVTFNQLLTITNMPISRFGSMLLSKKRFHDYMTLLKDNFSQQNLDNLMCKSLISIDWQGYVYDCDFNQMLFMPMAAHEADVLATDKSKRHISELLDHTFNGAPIAIGEHCYGCTAGQGSSCGGALG